jgi:SAM-dependent methyltransferase
MPIVSEETIKKRRLDYFKTKNFDKKYGIDTNNTITKAIDNIGNYRPYAKKPEWMPYEYNGYMGVCFFELEIINNFLKNNFTDLSKYTFVDVGCGKGKVLFYNLIKKLQYKKQIGIEIDNEIFNIANANLKKFEKNSKIYLINKDVLEYKHEDEPTVYFLFQTFNSEIYKIWIEKNKSVFLKNKTIFINVCPYDELENLFDAGLIFKDFKLRYSNEHINIFSSF